MRKVSAGRLSMADNTTIGITKDLKARIDQLAAKETLRQGRTVKPNEMVEILVVQKEAEKK